MPASRELIAEGTGSDPGALRLSTIPGGASRETFLAESDRGRWVLRRDPVGAQDSFAPLETEFRVVQTAAAAGVPVARGSRSNRQAGGWRAPAS